MAADDYERHDAWLDDYEEAGAVIRECVSDIEKLTGESVRRKKTKRKHFLRSEVDKSSKSMYSNVTLINVT